VKNILKISPTDWLRVIAGFSFKNKPLAPPSVYCKEILTLKLKLLTRAKSYDRRRSSRAIGRYNKLIKFKTYFAHSLSLSSLNTTFIPS
jgi:hypothetical protein